MSICKNQLLFFSKIIFEENKITKIKTAANLHECFFKKCNKVIVQTNHVKEEIFNKFKLEAIKTPIYETISPKKTNKIYDFISASNSSNKNHRCYLNHYLN